ncbi:MAG: ATP synthase F1 subunit gamma [Balneolales bacterium]
MANLRDIRDRISSVKSTQQITRAMKMVAAARLRKAQDRMNDARPYTGKIHNIVAELADRTDTESALLKSVKQPKNILLLVLGSDRGLCGGFNTNLFRIVEKKIFDQFSEQIEDGTFKVISIGKKSYDYFRTRNYTVIDHKLGFFDHLKYENVSGVINTLLEEFRTGTYDEVYLAYNEFKSILSQNRRFEKILPISRKDIMKRINRESGTDSKNMDKKKNLSDIDFLYEPDPSAILDHVLPLYVTIQLWQASLESFAAEQGARMAAMDSATENAGEIIRDLQLKYNQARQAAITTEISEIVSGAEALSE